MTIDCDFRPQEATTVRIAPYLDEGWRIYLKFGNRLDKDGGSSWTYPDTVYRPPLEGSPSGEAVLWFRSAEGDDADPEQVRAAARAHLDEHGIARAVLNPGTAGQISGVGNTDLAIDAARATNDWTVGEWLDADERLLGSIVVAPHDARAAAAEIRRLGDHPRMAQVVLAYPHRYLGNRAYHPIFEAANEHGLPVYVHAGGAYAGQNNGLTAVGHPASLFESRVSWSIGAQAHVASVVAEGVFEKYPDTRLVLGGFGIAWLPSLLWHMDMEYRAGRATPHVTRPPSEVVRDFVRFTTELVETPVDRRELETLLSLVRGEELLVFASGEHRAAPGAFSQRVRSGNASELYGRIGVLT